jgi:hypothetical protein
MGRRRRLVQMIAALAGAAAFASSGTAAVPLGPSHEVPGYGLTVSLPVGWRAVDLPPSLTPAQLAGLRRRNPALAPFLSSPSLMSIGIRLIGYEPPRGSFTVNLNVIVQPLPSGESLRAWMFSGSSSALQYVVKLTSVTAGSVRGLHFASTRVQKIGSTRLLTDDYAFAWGGHVFLFTYTARASDAKRYLPIFTASGRSIRFGAP